MVEPFIDGAGFARICLSIQAAMVRSFIPGAGFVNKLAVHEGRTRFSENLKMMLKLLYTDFFIKNVIFGRFWAPGGPGFILYLKLIVAGRSGLARAGL